VAHFVTFSVRREAVAAPLAHAMMTRSKEEEEEHALVSVTADTTNYPTGAGCGAVTLDAQV
jgi:hypothetical protein